MSIPSQPLNSHRAFVVAVLVWAIALAVYVVIAETLILDGLRSYVDSYGRVSAGGNFGIAVELYGSFIVLVAVPALIAIIVTGHGLTRQRAVGGWRGVKTATILLVPTASAGVLTIVISTARSIIQYSHLAS